MNSIQTGSSDTMYAVINGKNRLGTFEDVLKNLIQETFELREANRGLKADIENLRCRVAELESWREVISELPALSYGTCE